ncbi:hypothetical protein NKG99_29510 [Mesorhizobium sp. M1409]|uniref:hypothetical protein n=1 Tax=unclassified Mesorhizobium TaxID=325217 RepID=UPI00333DA7EE
MKPRHLEGAGPNAAMGFASLTLDLGVEEDATIEFIGEGDGYACFPPFAGDVGHFAGCTTPSSFRIGEQTSHCFKVAVTSHAMATTPQGNACFPSVAVWPRSQLSTPR